MTKSLPPTVLQENCNSFHYKSQTRDPTVMFDVGEDASCIAVDPEYVQCGEAKTKAQPSTQIPIKPFDLGKLPPELQVMVFDEIVLTAIGAAHTRNDVLNTFRAGTLDPLSVAGLLDAHSKSLVAIERVVAVDMSFAMQMFDSICRLRNAARGKSGISAYNNSVQHWEEVWSHARCVLVEVHREAIMKMSDEQLKMLKMPTLGTMSVSLVLGP